MIPVNNLVQVVPLSRWKSAMVIGKINGQYLGSFAFVRIKLKFHNSNQNNTWTKKYIIFMSKLICMYCHCSIT